MSIEYYIRRKAPQLYEVAKFDGGEQPLEVYNVDYSQTQRVHAKPASRCDCMAWRSGKTRPCKHVDMVALYEMRRRQFAEEMSRRGFDFNEAATFEFSLFVCEGFGREWRFKRSEPALKS